MGSEPTHDELLAADWAWMKAKMETALTENAKLRAENARLQEAGEKLVAYNREHFDKARAEYRRAEVENKRLTATVENIELECQGWRAKCRDRAEENARLREALTLITVVGETKVAQIARDALEGKRT